jgi:hypothetical protein
MRRRLRLSLALALLVSGCGIFETRTPEAPQEGRSDFQPPTSPDIVVQNLVSAIADRDVNNYLACLSDTTFGARSFRFLPSTNAARQYESIFQAWEKNSEQYYFNNLTSQSNTSSSSALILSSETLLPQGSDSAYYSANYTLLWPNKVSGNPQQVQGNLQFYLGVDRSSSWSIYRWVDSGIGDSLTWSDLKARFSQ